MIILIIFVLSVEGRFVEFKNRISKRHDDVSTRLPHIFKYGQLHFKSKTTTENTENVFIIKPSELFKYKDESNISSHKLIKKQKQYIKNMNAIQKKPISRRMERKTHRTDSSKNAVSYTNRVQVYVGEKLSEMFTLVLYRVFRNLQPLRDKIDRWDTFNIVTRPKFAFPQIIMKTLVTIFNKNNASKPVKQSVLRMYNAVFPKEEKLLVLPSFGILSKIAGEFASVFMPSQKREECKNKTSESRYSKPISQYSDEKERGSTEYESEKDDFPRVDESEVTTAVEKRKNRRQRFKSKKDVSDVIRLDFDGE